MSDTYIPLFTMIDEIMNIMIDIVEITGAMTVYE
jgi:hypothetical protein